MTIMYVDDSSSPNNADQTNYFVLSGVIVRDDNEIKDLQKAVCDYKYANFVDAYVDSEIHSHDINKSTGDFSSIGHDTKIDLLDGLYDMITSINCVSISTVINKSELERKCPTWRVFNTAWISLIERYDSFLKENDMGVGHVRVDKSSSRAHVEITKVFHELVDIGTPFQKIDHVLRPKFVNSSGVPGIQIADAFAYCIFQHKIQKGQFDKYWDIIRGKLLQRNSRVEGYGYREYPE